MIGWVEIASQPGDKNLPLVRSWSCKLLASIVTKETLQLDFCIRQRLLCVPNTVLSHFSFLRSGENICLENAWKHLKLKSTRFMKIIEFSFFPPEMPRTFKINRNLFSIPAFNPLPFFAQRILPKPEFHWKICDTKRKHHFHIGKCVSASFFEPSFLWKLYHSEETFEKTAIYFSLLFSSTVQGTLTRSPVET